MLGSQVQRTDWEVNVVLPNPDRSTFGLNTERSVRGALESGKPEYQPPKRQHPWRTQFVGALVGLVVIAVVLIALYLLKSFRP